MTGNGTIAALGGKLIGGLTPQYLGLLTINVVFLGCVFWLLVEQNATRERTLAPMLTACAKSVPMETFNMLLDHAYAARPPAPVP